MQNPSGSFSNVWRPSAPTLLRPYCAKKRPFVEHRIKSGRMGGFLQKGQAEAETGGLFQPWENYHTHQNRTLIKQSRKHPHHVMIIVLTIWREQSEVDLSCSEAFPLESPL